MNGRKNQGKIVVSVIGEVISAGRGVAACPGEFFCFIPNKVEKLLQMPVSRKAAKHAKRNNDRSSEETVGF